METILDRIDEKRPFSLSSVFIIIVVLIVLALVAFVLLYFSAFYPREDFNKTGYSERTSADEYSGVVPSDQDSNVPLDLFKIHDEKYSKELQNSSKIKRVVEYTGKPCLGKHEEVAFRLQLVNAILTCMYCCFDISKQISKYCVAPANGTANESYKNRPSFSKGSHGIFFNMNIDKQYTIKVQRKTINAILGLPEDSLKYIEGLGSIFFARGHLVAKTDFDYKSQQHLTFHYVNVAPQNQTFNNGNWKKIEDYIRRFKDNTGKELLIYTGTHGVLTLPHEKTGEDIELFLYIEDENKAIPIPYFFWKVVYEPETKTAIGIVGVNNPYYKDPSKDIICVDISSEIEWLHFDQLKPDAGYCYACDARDLATVVDEIPSIKIDSLLM